MLQDLHSHTYYSFCGKDAPEDIVEAAIAGGIEVFGITDHCHGIGNARLDVFYSASQTIARGYGRTLRRYFDHINLIREKYADKIRILRGIELTLTDNGARTAFPLGEDISYFDYCLIENPDHSPETDIFFTGKRWVFRWELRTLTSFPMPRRKISTSACFFRKWRRRTSSGR